VANTLQVEVVAADHPVWSGEANLVVARTVEGDIGIMAGHEPVLAVLETAAVRVHTGDGTVVAAVHGGFLSVADDRVAVLAETAELSDEIDLERARQALGEAEDDEARLRAETRVRVAEGN
jgi:F-type H+-transporting ATPase subunit epsilon